jgi:hypothetical protein
VPGELHAHHRHRWRHDGGPMRSRCSTRPTRPTIGLGARRSAGSSRATRPTCGRSTRRRATGCSSTRA